MTNVGSTQEGYQGDHVREKGTRLSQSFTMALSYSLAHRIFLQSHNRVALSILIGFTLLMMFDIMFGARI